MLVQPANDALKELKGCIAPGTFFNRCRKEKPFEDFFYKTEGTGLCCFGQKQALIFKHYTAKTGNGEIAVVQNFYIMNIMQKVAAPAMKFLKSCAI